MHIVFNRITTIYILGMIIWKYSPLFMLHCHLFVILYPFTEDESIERQPRCGLFPCYQAFMERKVSS